MNKKPKVSICIPVYNQRPEFLRECVHSALNQRYDSFEVVVSDNHSTNDVPEVLAEFKDTRLRVIKPPKHQSMAGNFAFCASQSVGEYICFLSSDDLMYPNCCRRLAGILDAHSNVAFVHCAARAINEKGEEITIQRSDYNSFIRKGIQELQRYIWENNDAFVGILIRRTAYNAAGGIVDRLSEVMDWYMSIRLLTVGDVAYCDEVFSCNRYWSSLERSKRLLPHIRDIRLLYEELETSHIVNLIEGNKETLYKARKQQAIYMSLNLSAHKLSPIEKRQIMNEILFLNNSWTVKCILNLTKCGMGPLFLTNFKIIAPISLWIKSFIYPKPRNSF